MKLLTQEIRAQLPALNLHEAELRSLCASSLNAHYTALPVVSATWRVLGLADALTSVDGMAAPFGGAKQLTTNADPAPGNSALSPLHSTPIVDGVTPLASDGTPLFAPVWRTLIVD